MRHIEVRVGPHTVTVEQVPTRWWLVDQALRGICRLTHCRACMTWPYWLHSLENHSINRPSRTRFNLPVDADHRARFAEWAGIELPGDEWSRDCEDD